MGRTRVNVSDKEAKSEPPTKKPTLEPSAMLPRSSFFEKKSGGAAAPKIPSVGPCIAGRPERIRVRDLEVGMTTKSIVGRVTLISEVREWNRNGVAGKSFTTCLQDESGEISVSFFNSHCDDFRAMIKINEVVEVTGLYVKETNPQFSVVPGQLLEVSLCPTATVKVVTTEVPAISFEFQNLEAINSAPVGTCIDFLGIAYICDNLVQGVSASGRAWSMKKLFVTDLTRGEFQLKLWGKLAETFVLNKPTVVALRRGKVDEYDNIKGLSTNFQTLVWIEPNVPEAEAMYALLEEVVGSSN